MVACECGRHACFPAAKCMGLHDCGRPPDPRPIHVNVAPSFPGCVPWPRRWRIAIVSPMATDASKVAVAAPATSANGAFLPRLNAVAADIEALLDSLLAGEPGEGEIARPARLV